MFFYVFGFQNTADIIDRHTDAEYGIRTFVVEFGVKGTSTIALSCIFVMIAIVIGGWTYGVYSIDYFTMLLIIPFCLVMWYHMRFNPHRVSSRTGNHPSWIWFYVGMVLCALIPTVTVIVRSFNTVGAV